MVTVVWVGSVAVAGSGDPYRVPAGRSPIPQAGESITRPLPCRRLSDADAAGPVEPPPPGAVPWRRAGRYLGHRLTVEGTVVDTHLLKSGEICFLNFSKNWRGKFCVVVLRDAFEGLPGPPHRVYLNQTIRVTGRVVLRQGVPQMVVRRVDQIERVD